MNVDQDLKTSVEFNNNGLNKRNERHHKCWSSEFFSWSSIVLAVAILFWYVAGVLCVITSKMIMTLCPLPHSLCLSQFLMAVICTRILSLAMRLPIVTFHGQYFSLIVWISLAYTLGFALTNYAISIANPSFVETIKASEPFFSVVIGWLILSERASALTYSTVVFICCGVGAACIGNTSYSTAGLIVAALSNVGFSCRSVFSKLLNSKYPKSIDEFSLFTHVSAFGIPVLLVFTTLFEINELSDLASNHRIIMDWQWLLTLVLFNGIVYSTYNMLSFFVLARTDLVTHAILNSVRRLANIFVAVVYFRNQLSVLNVFGVLVACLGVLAFAYTKNADNARKQLTS